MFYINQQQCYSLLFHAAWEALQKAGRNPSFLGVEVGAVAVLHTWGQTLTYHPHIHLLVPAVGLSDDGMEWVTARKNFFVPVQALSSIFRGILVRRLKQLIDQNALKLPAGFKGFESLKQKLYNKKWHVFSDKAFGGLSKVLEYLGRYTHRVGITNSRLIRMEKGRGDLLLQRLPSTWRPKGDSPGSPGICPPVCPTHTLIRVL
ncbi:hypothetical protein DMA11_22990 [Marinilabiliaceae bacterium JC017]|nr:hypothetical protein DMA11_22990 [Marinilabiliaceae bacterium JC017]